MSLPFSIDLFICIAFAEMFWMSGFDLWQESRVLKFWFSSETDYFDKVSSAYDFFKELIKPEQFPRGLFHF